MSNRIIDFIKEHKAIILIIFAFFVIKLCFLFHPLVSLEYMYTTPAQEIIKHGFSFHWNYLMYYFEIMSNPLLTSYMLIPGFLAFGFSEFIARLPVLLFAVIFLIVLYWFVIRYYNKNTAIIAAVLLALNPLFWLYSEQITTDIIFTFFISVAMLFCIEGILQKKENRFVISALFLALAMITKYIALLYYGLAALFLLFGIKYNSIREFLAFDNLRRIFYQGMPFGLLFLIIVVPYLLWMFIQFGFVMHPNLVELAWSRGVFAEMPLRFLGYLVWVAIFAGLFFLLALYDLYNRIRSTLAKKTIILYFILLLLLNVLLFSLIDIIKIYSLGELHFGGLQTLLSPLQLHLVLGLLVFCGEIIFLTIIFWFIYGSLLEKYFAAWIIYSLFALSTARPTQRYLMLIFVPLMIYFATLVIRFASQIRFKKMVWFLFYVNICVLLFFNLFLSVYEYKTSYAAKEIADYLLKNDIKAQIHYDVISHNYYLLNESPFYQLDKRKEVIAAFDREYLVTDKSNLGKIPFNGKFEIVNSHIVEILGIQFKEFVVAKRINNASVK